MKSSSSIRSQTPASPKRETRARRRIDWQVLTTEGSATPVWSAGPATSEFIALLTTFSELCQYENDDALLRHAVELALRNVGLIRAGIYLYDEPADLMLGTWGTSIDGNIIDEHHSMFTLGEDGRRVFDKAVAGEAAWTVIEHSPLIDQRGQVATVVGRGWVVCTPIRVADRCFGMLYNDPGLTGSVIDPDKQAQALVLCVLIAVALRARQHSNQYSSLPSTTARHPVLRKAVHRLRQDPSLGGAQLARELRVSLSHLARLFKTEIGISLVDYRNQLRMERLFALAEQGASRLSEAARAAGFGSYAQFHRVFRALHGQTPREYFAARGIGFSSGR